MRKPAFKSKFKNRPFKWTNIPAAFTSVTSKSIQKVRDYSERRVMKEFEKNPVPDTIQAHFESIDADFASGYTLLETDCTARRKALDNAHAAAKAELIAEISIFDTTVKNYNNLAQKYSDKVYAATGDRPDISTYTTSKLESLKRKCKKVIAKGA